MVQMNIQQILQDESVSDISVDHADVGSVSSDAADYFFVEATLADALGNIQQNKIVKLNSLIDKNETQQKLNEILDKNNIDHK